MTLPILFWVLYIVAIVFYGWRGYSAANPYGGVGSLPAAILIGLLGWQVFGAPVK